MTRYILPIICAVFLLLFFLGLPALDRISLPAMETEYPNSRKRITKIDAVLMLCITLLFGFVDFWHLGDWKGIETFASMNGRSVVLTLEEDADITAILYYTGIGIGNYMVEFSQDGETFEYALTISQEAGDVLKWKTISPDHVEGKIHSIRITGYGNVWLGEVALQDTAGKILSATASSPELTDETHLVQLYQTYMNSTYFDEIYHARTAWEHLNNVYPYEITHPPLGKIIISLGISLFGMTPFGWRFSGTLFGVLMLPVLYIFLKRLFGSTRVSVCGALILATDFMHYVQTRIATIDTYGVFFILLMYLFMYEFIQSGRILPLAFSGLFFGIGAACKWTCLYAGAGLAVIWGIYWIVHREKGILKFLTNALLCMVFFVLIPCIIYCCSYFEYGTSCGVKNLFSSDYRNIVLSNQKYMFSYHSALVAEHPYSSVWYQWILNIRPILYYLQYYSDGTRVSFGAWLNPVLCWGGLLALFVLIYRALFHKDREAGFILLGYMAQLVPWIFITRLTFEYHYFPCSIFLVLALGYVFHLMEIGTVHYKGYLYSFVGLSAAVFILFFPALCGLHINSALGTQLLGWLPTWPF